MKSFTNGKTIDFLSKKYECTRSTIVRNLKKELGEVNYKIQINKSKLLKENIHKEENEKNLPFDNEFNQNINKSKVPEHESKILNQNKSDENAFASFYEIAPLNYEIENATRKELSSVPISKVDLPKVVYMVVDKKIELETKLLKDYPEWSFLPVEDLNRKVIEIYFDLKTAQRYCNKEQKVIKVPNTNVFKIVAPLLTIRGISRIVTSDQLIAL